VKRIVSIDIETHPRVDVLDCFACIAGQSYRMISYPTDDPFFIQKQPDIDREFVAKALRKFADYIENSVWMKDDDIPDGRGLVRVLYAAGRL
jgi:hypothetical protein